MTHLTKDRLFFVCVCLHIKFIFLFFSFSCPSGLVFYKESTVTLEHGEIFQPAIFFSSKNSCKNPDKNGHIKKNISHFLTKIAFPLNSQFLLVFFFGIPRLPIIFWFVAFSYFCYFFVIYIFCWAMLTIIPSSVRAGKRNGWIVSYIPFSSFFLIPSFIAKSITI